MTWTIEGRAAVVTLAAREAAGPAVRLAAHAMTDRAYVQLEDGPRRGLLVRLEPKLGGPDGLAESFAEELRTQRLRLALSKPAARLRLYQTSEAVR